METKITDYLTEDVPSFDFGGFVVGNTPETGSLYMKQSGVIWYPFVNEVFHQCNLQHKWIFSEGQFVSDKEIASAGGKIVVCTVKGSASNILLAERTALNLLSRASGLPLNLIKLKIGR